MQQEFKNRYHVWQYLKAQGWKVARGTFYNHVKEGRLRPDARGVFSLEKIEKYLNFNLKTKELAKTEKLERVQEKKARLEANLLEVKVNRERLKYNLEQGKSILRDDVELELAGKAVVLETNLKAMILARAGEFVALVEGQEKKTGELVRAMMTELDQALNEFATTREYQVVFEAENGE